MPYTSDLKENFSKTKSNRNAVQRFFITIPKSEERPRDFILNNSPPLTYYLCALEQHEDGSPHLHALIILKNKLTKAKLLKYLQTRMPECSKRLDVQVCVSAKHVIDYIKKEDASPEEVGTVSLGRSSIYSMNEQRQVKARQRNANRAKNLPTSRDDLWMESVLDDLL